MKRSEVINYNT